MRTLLVIELVPESTNKYIVTDDGQFYDKYNKLSDVVFNLDVVTDEQSDLADELSDYAKTLTEASKGDIVNIDNVVWHTFLL